MCVCACVRACVRAHLTVQARRQNYSNGFRSGLVFTENVVSLQLSLLVQFSYLNIFNTVEDVFDGI